MKMDTTSNFSCEMGCATNENNALQANCSPGDVLGQSECEDNAWMEHIIHGLQTSLSEKRREWIAVKKGLLSKQDSLSEANCFLG
jgi:hypothetical protein